MWGVCMCVCVCVCKCVSFCAFVVLKSIPTPLVQVFSQSLLRCTYTDPMKAVAAAQSEKQFTLKLMEVIEKEVGPMECEQR